jgi:hypothetical protein
MASQVMARVWGKGLRQGLGFQQTSTAKRRGFWNKQREERKSTRQSRYNLKQLQRLREEGSETNKGKRGSQQDKADIISNNFKRQLKEAKQSTKAKQIFNDKNKNARRSGMRVALLGHRRYTHPNPHTRFSSKWGFQPSEGFKQGFSEGQSLRQLKEATQTTSRGNSKKQNNQQRRNRASMTKTSKY